MPAQTLFLAQAASASRRRSRDWISLAAGALVLAAIAFVLVIDLWWGLTHDGYSYVADTISDLAAGVNSWTMDLALTGLAVAVGLLALALARLDLGEATGRPWRYRLGCLIVLLLAPVLYLIAGHDAYGDGERGGTEIHIYLVYALGVAFPLAAWLLGPGFQAVSNRWRDVSLAVAVVWIVAAPPFLFMPTGFDGLYERALALVLLAWFALAALNLVREGRGRL